MRQSLTGLYFTHFSYSDTSIIVKVFTKEYGLKSFILKGAKGKKGLGVLQPFHLLEVTCNYNPNKELNFATGIRLYKPSKSITIDIRKSTVAIFITEILYRSIREEEENLELYEFLEKKIIAFDEEEFNPDFHLCFLMELTRYFGFYPSLPDLPSNKYFNLIEGQFEYPKVLTPDHLNEEISRGMKDLIEDPSKAIFSNKMRSEILNSLVRFYEKHMHLKQQSIKSHKILQAVFMD